MANPMMLWMGLILLFSLHAHAEFVEQTLVVHQKVVWRMCKSQEITVVNGSFPGPTISVHEGDSVAIHVINKSPYNMTIHWHGVFQLLSSWSDGPAFISQCPILPGNKYTYRFNISGQEGTLFWHAHSGWHRATVHGAFIIRPKKRSSYPFSKPDGEFPIVIGEWFNSSIVDLENQLLFYGNGPNYSQSLTINGWPGDLYPCSSRRRFLPEDHNSSLCLDGEETDPILDDIYKVKVKSGKTYMLRIICANLNNHAFFSVAAHIMTVVAIDAVYTTPYTTNIVVLAPGQTVDVLITTNQQPSSYYMASRYYYPLIRVDGVPPNNTRNATPQTSVLIYEDASIFNESTPILPKLPEPSDVETAFRFLSSLEALQDGPHWSPVPHHVDEHMFITAGLGVTECIHEDTYLCQGPNFTFMAASLNNASFKLPTKMSILLLSFVLMNDFRSLVHALPFGASCTTWISNNFYS
ncbi:hypothetical protein Leryth_026032 [Lithospermum erythrorhizon]|nr:hypothetical protein Leryth_026032 [Lithospermum erythrorhizon]